jgi:predicted ATPase
MQAEITIKNYRCFSESKPAHLNIRDGFTAFLGVNNSGKSSLLKLFFEFRHLFARLSNLPNGEIIPGLLGTQQPFPMQSTISDNREIFFKGNRSNIEITLRVLPRQSGPSDGILPVERLVIIIARSSNLYTLQAKTSAGPVVPAQGHLRLDGTVLWNGDNQRLELGCIRDILGVLASTLYIGPFRNAINLGTKADYFDIAVGQSFIQAWRAYKTGSTIAHNEAAYGLTQDIRRIFGFRTLEINTSADDQSLKLLINGQSYTLSELGSGLAQFVLVLANAATKRPAIILIDEPELNLHPSLQLYFLTTLGSYATNGLMFATHSYDAWSPPRQHFAYCVAAGPSASRIVTKCLCENSKSGPYNGL